MWFEIVFNVAYLLTLWWLVSAMVRRRSKVAPDDRAMAGLVMWAFALLALGDTGHVGSRVLAYALGDLEVSVNLLGRPVSLVGLGAMATAFTVTIFYVLMLVIWRVRFDKRYGWFEYLLFAAAVARGVLMLFPANEWGRVTSPQPWSTYRNLPLMLLGLGVAFLILRNARVARDQTFLWVGVLILISYTCYIPVIFFVQRVPNIGMLMIPKTVAYLVIGFLVYRELYGKVSLSPG
ncbi:MAG: hypothetical protein U9R15_07930 [Chloroflexota bacterium]|nr:hypothetical protein [Chloroflexota bacterium]